MTLGEKIRYYRKAANMSQEQLGSILFLSRQTVSYWENDQTVPTVENLVDLGKVFGVTVDELLSDLDPKSATDSINGEVYNFEFSKDEIKKINKIIYYRKLAIPVMILLVFAFHLITNVVSIRDPALFYYQVVGILIVVGNIISRVSHLKGKMIGSRTYRYEVKDGILKISIIAGNDLQYFNTFKYSQADQRLKICDTVLMAVDDKYYPVRINDVPENSTFALLLRSSPSDFGNSEKTIKEKIISVILFTASIFSVFIAQIISSVLSVAHTDVYFTAFNWVFFPMAVIPTGSVVFGYYMRSKGKRFRKNIIVGYIMIVILFMFGSFCFIQ